MNNLRLRAWHKKGQYMFIPIGASYIDGYLTCIIEKKSTNYNSITEHLDETWYEEYREPDYGVIPLYSTGLPDKTGKMIFEGDVLKWIDDENAVVEWWDGDACFDTSPTLNGFQSSKTPYYEILGNIYQHPELLSPTPNE